MEYLTSLSECKKLRELGLNIKTSVIRCREGEHWFAMNSNDPMKYEADETIPTYTVGELMSIIPKRTLSNDPDDDMEYVLTIQSDLYITHNRGYIEGWLIYYHNIEDDRYLYFPIEEENGGINYEYAVFNRNPSDGLSKMIQYLVKYNNYVKIIDGILITDYYNRY